MFRLAADLHGGDHGVSVVLPASLSFLSRYSDTEVTLFGDAGQSTAWGFLDNRQLSARLQWTHALPNAEADSSTRALYGKQARHEALSCAMLAHQAGLVDAIVTAEDTRLLIVRARQFMGFPDSRPVRPVLSAWLPSYSGRVLVADVGASTRQDTGQLLRTARLAHAFLTAARLGREPRVGVLNIGTEPGKARSQMQPLMTALEATGAYDLVGFVEPADVLDGQVDLVLTDGFTGNIMLKSMSASVRHARRRIATAVSQTWWRRVSGMLLSRALRADLVNLNPDEFNGAPLLGLNGWVVKSHGNADVRGFERALEQARVHLREGIPARVRTFDPI